MKRSEKELRTRLGTALKAARLAKGLTQNQLAEAVETDPETISRFERGATLPSLMRLLDLAEAVEVPVALLLGAASPEHRDEWDHVTRAVAELPARDQELVAALVTTVVNVRKR